MRSYLEEQWHKIEYKSRVSSTKNIANHISLVHNRDIDEVIEDIRIYFEDKNDVLFVNEYQFVDIKSFKDYNISNCDELKDILRNEYYISRFNDKNLQKYFKRNRCSKVATSRTNKYIDIPLETINVFYYAHQKSLIVMSDNLEIARMLNNYFIHQNAPKKIDHIYNDLTGAIEDLTKEKINYILHNYANFKYLHNGYWIGSNQNRELGERLLINYLLYKNIASKSIHELVKKFLEKGNTGKELNISTIIQNIEMIGLEANIHLIEDALIKMDYIELYPGCWDKNLTNIYNSSKFNLTKRWNETYNNVIESLKNDSELETLNRRIIENQTLEEVGAIVGVTRERIRQIEKSVRRKMMHPFRSGMLKNFYNWINKSLNKEKIIDLSDYGVKKEEYKVFDLLVCNYFQDKNILRICDDILIHKIEYDKLNDKLDSLSSNNKIIDIRTLGIKWNGDKKSELYSKLFIEDLMMIKMNDNEFYYSRGRVSNEDELYLILNRFGKPIHYSQIHELARKFGLPCSIKPGRNTLATMQRQNKFIRVAPGTYGLKEWNNTKHVFIKDLLYVVLVEENRPLYYNEFFTLVQSHRYDEIKETSFQAYLSECEDIAYIYTEQYILKEWLEDKEWLGNVGIDLQRIVDGNYLFNNKVILDVYKYNGNFVTKYKMSEASLNGQTLRISRKVELGFGRRICVIDKNNVVTFNSFNVDLISSINRWSYVPKVNEIFYLEFINERIVRYLSTEKFKNYKSVDRELLESAELYWKEQMEILLGNEEKDEIVIEEIESVEGLIEFGLDHGYVYYETIEKLVNEGNNLRKIMFILDERNITINY